LSTLNVVQAVNHALREEMTRNDKVVILGEDVGVNGGVFRATEGLYQEFGPNRVIDTPLAESGIIGVSIGMALYGLRPVPEIQFMDLPRLRPNPKRTCQVQIQIRRPIHNPRRDQNPVRRRHQGQPLPLPKH
jgi:hypothetical protein